MSMGPWRNVLQPQHLGAEVALHDRAGEVDDVTGEAAIPLLYGRRPIVRPALPLWPRTQGLDLYARSWVGAASPECPAGKIRNATAPSPSTKITGVAKRRIAQISPIPAPLNAFTNVKTATNQLTPRPPVSPPARQPTPAQPVVPVAGAGLQRRADDPGHRRTPAVRHTWILPKSTPSRSTICN